MVSFGLSGFSDILVDCLVSVLCFGFEWGVCLVLFVRLLLRGRFRGVLSLWSVFASGFVG